jgi:hypothetical protein
MTTFRHITDNFADWERMLWHNLHNDYKILVNYVLRQLHAEGCGPSLQDILRHCRERMQEPMQADAEAYRNHTHSDEARSHQEANPDRPQDPRNRD